MVGSLRTLHEAWLTAVRRIRLFEPGSAQWQEAIVVAEEAGARYLARVIAIEQEAYAAAPVENRWSMTVAEAIARLTPERDPDRG